MAEAEAKHGADLDKKEDWHDTSSPERQSIQGSVIVFEKEDVLSAECIDPALDARIRLVNAAIDEIGMTPYQWKMFCLAGFGYFVGNMMLVAQSVITGQAALELLPNNPDSRSLTVALGVGIMIGTTSWGLTSDIIGRRWAFNLSLIVCAIFGTISGAAPNWNSLATFVAFGGMGIGGTWALDATTLIEVLPTNYQWLVILLGTWWGLGQALTGFFAWGFLPNYSCESAETCTYKNNMGWRYVWFGIGGLTTVLAILRITVIRMRESPKYLIAEGNDAEAVNILQSVAQKYGRSCSLTLEQLTACGERRRTGFVAHAEKKFSLQEMWVHLKGLFASKRIGLSFLLVCLSNMLQGLGYAMFFFFIPIYLKASGKEFGSGSPYETWRNYTLTSIAVIVAAFPAAYLAETRLLGRRYTMAISATLCFAFYLAYIQVKTEAENIAYSCVISFSIACYIDVFYAYGVEVFPSAHRATGLGMANAETAIMTMSSGFIGSAADPSTPVPLYICAVLWFLCAVIAFCLPFETRGKGIS